MKEKGRYLHEVKTQDGEIKYFDDCGDAFGYFCHNRGVYDHIVYKTYKEVPPLYGVTVF